MTTENTQHKDTDPDKMLQIMMSEYAMLQSASSSTIFDASGRVNLYIGSISSVLVALAFIGQAADMGESFFIFALVLLLPLILIGVTTFNRTLQIAIEDVVYRRGINRIRHFYTEVAPETARYFILPTYDDMAAILQEPRPIPSLMQLFLSTPGMVSGLNSLLLAVFAGIMVHVLFEFTLLSSLIVAVVGFVFSLIGHTRVQNHQWGTNEKRIKTLFPTPQP